MSSRDAVSAGKPVILAGRLIDTVGRPQAGFNLQVWQANSTGRYDYHPGETPGHGRPDPAFRGHGQSEVDADGWFAFRTIRPGGYRRTLFGLLPWTGVPHIHVAVRSAERDLLITQADLDKVVARRAPVAYGDHAELMRSAAMRRLAAATGSGALAGADLPGIYTIADDMLRDSVRAAGEPFEVTVRWRSRTQRVTVTVGTVEPTPTTGKQPAKASVCRCHVRRIAGPDQLILR
jgi:hypothetical protein